MNDDLAKALIAHMARVEAALQAINDKLDLMPRVTPAALRVRKMRAKAENVTESVTEQLPVTPPDRGETTAPVTRNNGRNTMVQQVFSNSSSLVTKATTSSKDPGGVVAVTPVTPSPHRQLMQHGEAVLREATGNKPDVGKAEVGIAQTMLKTFGLERARRAFDLAAARYRRDKFWRDQGLTFRIVSRYAKELLSAAPPEEPVAPEDNGLALFAAGAPADWTTEQVLEAWHQRKEAG